MAQTEFLAPGLQYPLQLEGELRGLAGVPATGGLHCCRTATGVKVVYGRDLSAAERSAVQAAIDAHVPDHTERDRNLRMKVIARQLRTAHERWGILTTTQKDDALHALVEAFGHLYRDLAE